MTRQNIAVFLIKKNSEILTPVRKSLHIIKTNNHGKITNKSTLLFCYRTVLSDKYNEQKTTFHLKLTQTNEIEKLDLLSISIALVLLMCFSNVEHLV